MSDSSDDAQPHTTTCPFFGTPHCATLPDKLCVEECEYGLAGPCIRKRRSDALYELGQIDGETL